MENLYQIVGKRVKFFREQVDLTQAELAEKVGISNNYIGLIERGIKHATLDTLNRISQALDVKLCDLLIPLNNRPEDNEQALKELKRLLNKRKFKNAKLLLSIYKSICEHLPMT